MKSSSYYWWRFAHNSLVHGLLIGIVGEWGWVQALHDWTDNKWAKSSTEGGL